MAKKRLPIGVQDFGTLIEGDYLYVDKTEHYHRLITKGKYYFLSRPRRFGKSLLITTMRAIFEGRRELFDGLWIQNKIDWEPLPVIHLDFTRISKRAPTLEEGIRLALHEIAEAHGLTLTEPGNPGRLDELIRTLGRERKVAILVDEYDKPLIDNIDDLQLLNSNRQVLKNMYSVIKGNDAYISFFMLTGVTKFSQLSIFSDLNHLKDISLAPGFSQMLGYTHAEILQYFPDRLEELKASLGGIYPDVLAEMKAWYNGYSWDGAQQVYNPFSILNLLDDQRFGDYWFATGTPTFLMKMIRQAEFSAFEFEDKRLSLQAFNTFDVPDIDIHSLLFQTGYLTIKAIDYDRQTVTLGFPNREVSNAFSFHMLMEFAEKRQGPVGSLLLQMNDCLQAGDVDGFITGITALFGDIGYPIHPAHGSGIANMERYYHSMFFLMLRLLGYNIASEVLVHSGRIDAVINTERHIYIVEFKLGDAASAMAQLRERRYHLKYMASGKQVMLLGIGFDVAVRNVGDWVVEEA